MLDSQHINILFSGKSTRPFLKKITHPHHPVQRPTKPHHSQPALLVIILDIRSKYLHTPPSSRRSDLFQGLTRLRRRRLQRLAQRDGRRDIKARRNGSLELAAQDLLDSATGGDVGCFSDVDGLLVDLVVSVWLCRAGEGMRTGPVGMLRGCRLVEQRETGGEGVPWARHGGLWWVGE